MSEEFLVFSFYHFTQTHLRKLNVNRALQNLQQFLFGLRSGQRERMAAPRGVRELRSFLPCWASDSSCSRLRSSSTRKRSLVWTKHGIYCSICIVIVRDMFHELEKTGHHLHPLLLVKLCPHFQGFADTDIHLVNNYRQQWPDREFLRRK